MENAIEMFTARPMDNDVEVKKEKRIRYQNEAMQKYLKYLDLLASRKGGPFLLGEAFCIGDLYLFQILQVYKRGSFFFFFSAIFL